MIIGRASCVNVYTFDGSMVSTLTPKTGLDVSKMIFLNLNAGSGA